MLLPFTSRVWPDLRFIYFVIYYDDRHFCYCFLNPRVWFASSSREKHDKKGKEYRLKKLAELILELILVRLF